jgi:hypothetical protein
MHASLLVLAMLASSRPFVSEDARFSVMFPGEPSQDTLALPAQPLRYNFHLANDKGAYFVVFTCLPSAELRGGGSAVLDRGRDSGLQTTGGTSVHEERIRVSGHAGRDLVTKMPDGTLVYSRAVLGEHGAYYSLSAVPRAAQFKSEALKFLRSFAVLPPSNRGKCSP